jgi:CspA family cold shock protein
MLGEVKWFSNSRGFGFIKSLEPNDDREFFVHYLNIDNEGYKTLDTGQKVEFEAIDTPRGIQAGHVRPI